MAGLFTTSKSRKRTHEDARSGDVPEPSIAPESQDPLTPRHIVLRSNRGVERDEYDNVESFQVNDQQPAFASEMSGTSADENHVSSSSSEAPYASPAAPVEEEESSESIIFKEWNPRRLKDRAATVFNAVETVLGPAVRPRLKDTVVTIRKDGQAEITDLEQTEVAENTVLLETTLQPEGLLNFDETPVPQAPRRTRSVRKRRPEPESVTSTSPEGPTSSQFRRRASQRFARRQLVKGDAAPNSTFVKYVDGLGQDRCFRKLPLPEKAVLSKWDFVGKVRVNANATEFEMACAELNAYLVNTQRNLVHMQNDLETGDFGIGFELDDGQTIWCHGAVAFQADEEDVDEYF